MRACLAFKNWKRVVGENLVVLQISLDCHFCEDKLDVHFLYKIPTACHIVWHLSGTQ